MACCVWSCRGQRTGHRCKRVLQELGRPYRLHRLSLARGGQTHKTPGPEPASGSAELRKQTQRVVSPSEGNEARRDGRWGVAVSHSTAEAGERRPSGPWGGKGTLRHGPVGGHPVRDSVPCLPVTVTPADSTAARQSVAERTGCLNWARPDLWEPWGAIPTATRLFVLRSEPPGSGQAPGRKHAPTGRQSRWGGLSLGTLS